MKPSDVELKFGVCPKCGADTRRVDGKLKCKNCGYVEEIK